MDANYTNLLNRIGDRYSAGKAAAITTVNRELLLAYWDIGWYTVEYEQEGKLRAEYGKKLVGSLAKDLMAVHGRGFSRSNLNGLDNNLLVSKY